jgi:hypothetical protein
MSRGPGTHQREILARLDTQGWCWLRDLPYTSPADRTSYWRAARRLERLGVLRIEKRTRHFYLQPWTLLVSVTQFQPGTVLPPNEPYWPAAASVPEVSPNV